MTSVRPCKLVQAGQAVTVMYNNRNTNLEFAGDEVFLTGGFNRWQHGGGKLGPLKMTRATPGSEHLEVCVAVPPDAWMMDMVFSTGGVAPDAADAVYGGTVQVQVHPRLTPG